MKKKPISLSFSIKFQNSSISRDGCCRSTLLCPNLEFGFNNFLGVCCCFWLLSNWILSNNKSSINASKTEQTDEQINIKPELHRSGSNTHSHAHWIIREFSEERKWQFRMAGTILMCESERAHKNEKRERKEKNYNTKRTHIHIHTDWLHYNIYTIRV